MLHPETPEGHVGVIVGRFQVPALHEGHNELIRSVAARHQKVIVMLGTKPGVLVTRRNPLDFATRKAMIQGQWPEVVVLPLPDQPTDEGWSRDLDRRLGEVTDPATCVLYGSRDGFVPAYSGRWPVVELAAAQHISGSEIRASINHDVRESEDFRRGVIYAAHNRHPVSYQTTDAVVIDRDKDRVLVGRKATDPPGQWRFFGGFVDPRRDETLEGAASRELGEETSMIGVHVPPLFLGSVRVDDWRYRTEEDKILTAFFAYTYAHGSAVPSDDMDEVTWLTFDQLVERFFVKGHRPLLHLLTAHLQGS